MWLAFLVGDIFHQRRLKSQRTETAVILVNTTEEIRDIILKRTQRKQRKDRGWYFCAFYYLLSWIIIVSIKRAVAYPWLGTREILLFVIVYTLILIGHYIARWWESL